MQFKLFVIPISNCEQAVAEMNAFLRGHKIIAVTKEFVATGENSFYSIIAEYIDTAFAPAADKGKASVDYKEVLKPEVFELFSYLRDERKKCSGNECPACTNSGKETADDNRIGAN